MLMLSRAFIVYLVLFCAAFVQAQERFSFFQPSTPESVTRMLELAGLRDDDVLLDLGSGNGLIPLMAAAMNPKLRARGVDIDEKLVRDSNEAAQAKGVADRVKFSHRNAFDADLKEATVITMWLFPELMRLLRPTILEKARPGTRVLTSTWDLGSWPHDETDGGNPTIYKWVVPARVGGFWSWELPIAGRRIAYASIKEQRFQNVEGVVRSGNHREVLGNMKLSGENISFTLEMTLPEVGLARHAFKGKVHGERIEGTVAVSLKNNQNHKIELPWRATRNATSFYFEPTGTFVKTD